MSPFSILLLAFTLAMIAVHLATMALVRRMIAAAHPRWLTPANLVRFEGVYYLALAAFVLWYPDRRLLWPLLVMGTLHVGGWALAEIRPQVLSPSNAGGDFDRILCGFQVFDWLEALVLLWIVWALVRPAF